MSENNSELLTAVERLCSLHERMLQAQLELIAGQQDLILALRAEQAEVWISKQQAMDEVLFVSERSFYRMYDAEHWPRKKIGKKWYYLRNAMAL